MNKKAKGILIVIIILTSVIMISLILTTQFLSSELLKKFDFWTQFVETSNNFYTHQYQGSKNENISPGMRNIVLSNPDGKNFSALIFCKIKIFGNEYWDPYGFVESKNGKAIFSSYLGEGGTLLGFYINNESKITISRTDNDQKLIPSSVYPPHFWQK